MLLNLTPKTASAFLDDIGIHGPKTKYNNEEVIPRIRRWVLEHLVNLN